MKLNTIGTLHRAYGLPWKEALEVVEKAGLKPEYEVKRGKTTVRYYQEAPLDAALKAYRQAKSLKKAEKYVKVSPGAGPGLEALSKTMQHDHEDLSKDMERLLEQVSQLIAQNQVLNHRITKMQEDLLAAQKQQMEAVIRAFGGNPGEVLG